MQLTNVLTSVQSLPIRLLHSTCSDAIKAMPSIKEHGLRPFGMFREAPESCMNVKDIFTQFPAKSLLLGTISIRGPKNLTKVPYKDPGILVPSKKLEPCWNGDLPSRKGTCYFGNKASDYLWFGHSVQEMLLFANKAERDWVSFRLPLYISIMYPNNPGYEYIGPFQQCGLPGCEYFAQLHGSVLPDEVWEGLPNEDGTYTWTKIIQRYGNV